MKEDDDAKGVAISITDATAEGPHARIRSGRAPARTKWSFSCCTLSTSELAQSLTQA